MCDEIYSKIPGSETPKISHSKLHSAAPQAEQKAPWYTIQPQPQLKSLV